MNVLKSAALRTWLFWAVGVLFAAHELRLCFGMVGYTSDSVSYLHDSAIRQPGYPLYLHLLGVEAAVRLQVLVYTAAVLALAVAICRRGAPLFAAALLLLAMADFRVDEMHMQVMSDSLFLSFSLLMISALVWFHERQLVRFALAAGVFAALAAAIRPTGPVFIVLTPLALLLCTPWRTMRAWRAVAVALLPILLCSAALQGANHAIHGSETTSLLGRHMFAKAALIEAPPEQNQPTDPDERRLVQALQQDYASIRDAVAAIPDQGTRILFLNDYETCLEWDCQAYLRTGSPQTEAQMNALELRVAVRRIAHNPLGFAGLTWTNYSQLWLPFRSSVISPRANGLWAARTLPFANFVAQPPMARKPGNLVLDAVTAALGILTLGLSLAAFYMAARPMRPNWPCFLAMAGSLYVQGIVAVSAIFGPVTQRYVHAIWPVLMAVTVASALAILPYAKRFFASRSQVG